MAASIAVSAALVGLVGCGSDDEATPTNPTLELSEVDPGASDGSSTTRSDDEATSTTTAPPDDGPIDLGPLPELTELERSFADAVVEAFEADDGGFFPEADVECMAVRWVALIGEDALTASGMTPEQFGEDGPAEIGIDRVTAEQMVRIMEGCGGELEVFYEAFVQGFTGTAEDLGEAEMEMLTCMREVVPVADLREAMITSFMGDDDAGMDAIGDRWLECVPSGR